jgi:hypothetical protein
VWFGNTVKTEPADETETLQGINKTTTSLLLVDRHNSGFSTRLYFLSESQASRSL